MKLLLDEKRFWRSSVEDALPANDQNRKNNHKDPHHPPTGGNKLDWLQTEHLHIPSRIQSLVEVNLGLIFTRIQLVVAVLVAENRANANWVRRPELRTVGN